MAVKIQAHWLILNQRKARGFNRKAVVTDSVKT